MPPSSGSLTALRWCFENGKCSRLQEIESLCRSTMARVHIWLRVLPAGITIGLYGLRAHAVNLATLGTHSRLWYIRGLFRSSRVGKFHARLLRVLWGLFVKVGQ